MFMYSHALILGVSVYVWVFGCLCVKSICEIVFILFDVELNKFQYILSTALSSLEYCALFGIQQLSRSEALEFAEDSCVEK